MKRLAKRMFSGDTTIQMTPLEDKPFVMWDKQQLGLCVRVRPTGVKTFKVAYQHTGHTRWYTIGKYGDIGLSEARRIARKVREEAAGGGDPQKEKLDARKEETLRTLHERYLDLKAKKDNKSWQYSAALLEKHVLRKYGNRKAKEITRKDMWNIYDDLNDRPALANAVLNATSAVFAWAFKREIVPDNPCRGIERHKTNSSPRFLSNDEIRSVWPLLSEPLQLILLTAQRPGEVCGMLWQHIDMEAGLWSMPGGPTTGWKGTKNKRDHDVPLTEPVLTILRDIGPKPSGFVFSRRGKAITIPSTRNLWMEAGIPRFRPHDLRASAATGLDALGVSRDHIALCLNHADGGVTASYVRHDRRAHKRRALEAWARHLSVLLAG